MMNSHTSLVAVIVILVLTSISGFSNIPQAPTHKVVMAAFDETGGGGGGYSYLNVSGMEVTVYLHSQHSVYDVLQQENFSLMAFAYTNVGPFSYVVNISISGDGLGQRWFNYSAANSGIGIYESFNVTPTSAGKLFWNVTAEMSYYDTLSKGSRTSEVHADPTGNLSVLANRTQIYRNQTVKLQALSTVSGGSYPYSTTWYENGRALITLVGANSSYDPAFRTSGNYTFCVVLNDSANFEIIGNNVTIHVESPPQVLFIHPAVLIANETYPIQLDINSSLAFNQTAIMPDGSHHTGKNLSFSYKFNNSGLNVITSEVYWNGSGIESLNLSVYVEPVSLVLYPEVLPESGTVYFNLSADSNLPVTGANVSVKGIPGTVTQFWQSRLIQLGLVSSYGQQYNLSAAMNEFLFTAGSYYANFTATDSQGITARESIRFIVNFSFAYVSISFSENVTNGLLKLVASTTSNYTVEWAMLQLSGPSGVTEYNMSLSEFNASTHTWTWSQTIDVYSLGGGTYTALISAENSRNFTNYSSFSFGVTPPSQPYAFSFLSVVDAFGGPTNFVVAVSAIVGIIGVLAAVFSRGSETVVIGGQPYRSKPGRPLVRLKRGKK